MDYRVLFTPKALNDLAEIIGYLAEGNPEAASRFGSALFDHVQSLSSFPRMGSAIRKRSRVRKLIHTPIVVYYRILEDKQMVEVLHLRHASRRPPKL